LSFFRLCSQISIQEQINESGFYTIEFFKP